ncbi:MAG TPA: immune inhibitor A, partial [Aggregatilineales bacterium]|nr:immune inhibitor A [Aggregatilineales bacterium]
LWDFAYVTVSTDGGQTWDILETPYTTTEDPHGNSYGPGYTGRSADHPDANAEGWLHEAIDLSAYAGQEIMIGFEMLTDDAVNQPGLAIDNICIEAIDWCDDLEGDLEGWEAAGFVAHSNALPQRFSVQVIVTPPGEGTQVLRVPLDEENRGELTFTIGDRPAVLVVSGLTRHTTEPAQYRYTLTPGG